jgi:hypothetical protein
MSTIIDKIFSNKHNDTEWFFMKFSVSALWLSAIFLIVRGFSSLPLPIGVCTWFPCVFFLHFPFNKILLYSSVIIAYLYIFEIKVLWTSFIMFLISLLVFSIEESNGILERRGLLTFIFLAQFVAYFLHNKKNHFNLKKYRIQFSVQVVAAGYVLAGLSKLIQSGWKWILDGERITLQILKSHYYTYIDLGNEKWLIKGYELVNFIESHPYLLFFLLASSLLLELGAFLVIFSRRHAIIYGLLLLSMHIGIYWVMEIAIVSILFPMLIFLINPLYLLWVFLCTFLRKLFYNRGFNF